MSGGGIIIAKGGGPRGPRIPGVFPSARYGEQVVSTGLPSLDSFIGGGLPLKTICIVLDTFPCTFGDCILKTFLAEGATYNHHLFVGSGLDYPFHLGDNLPSLLKAKKGEEGVDDERDLPEGSSLKIAWRYGPQHQQTSPGGSKPSKEIHKFEFVSKVSASKLGASHQVNSLVTWDRNSLSVDRSEDLLREIAHVVAPFQVVENKPSPSNLVRIALSHCENQVLSPVFLRGLRALVRHTNSVAVVTLRAEAAGGSALLKEIEHFGDYVISLSAVVDEQRRTDFGFIDGICDFKKITSVNSLKPLDHPRDIAFSYHKSRLFFHELNLPPEGENTPQREVSAKHPKASPSIRSSPSSSSCGVTVKGKSIDF